MFLHQWQWSMTQSCRLWILPFITGVVASWFIKSSSHLHLLHQWARCKHINIPTEGKYCCSYQHWHPPSARLQFTLTACSSNVTNSEKLQRELKGLMAAVLIQKYLQYTTNLNERSIIDRALCLLSILTAPVPSNWLDLSLLASWKSAEHRGLPHPRGYKYREREDTNYYPEPFAVSLSSRRTGPLTPWR